ncbi:hypothetical protein TD95_002796 [Thielaviopsis punctulata]|uniref:Cytochrome b561 domain-containing protein n=1 Tax=Thielaviopsis punctulata TaxID=72032 RepID=A0A0F4ZJ84_9PEZI|nr:hypothetical protein TD95_002796 [Thielaviopsis punctulata]
MSSIMAHSAAKTVAGFVACALLASPVNAFHDNSRIPNDATISSDPVDAILWLHIFTMMLAVGILYPTGMVLGITKNRWHIPVQILATALAAFGYILGYLHKGRMFNPDNVHVKFAGIMFIAIVAQVVLGFYLWLPFGRGIGGRIGSLIRPVHSILGKAFPVLAWAQMVFGGITTLGFCQGEHVGQCAAHFIMGGAFVAYATIMALLLAVGQMWLRRTGRSQEFFDSAVIAAWGCVNTFTEHRWGTDWVKNDWQHTTMGVIWWAAGLSGVWLSKDRYGNPKRNFIPGFVLFITGWAMSAHPQENMTATMMHTMFGYTLMAAGLARIIEISFVLKDRPALTDDGYSYNSFQYIPIYLLFIAGFMFMSATEEQMELVENSDMDHISYILITFSLASIMFLFVNVLIHFYDRLSGPTEPPSQHQPIPQYDDDAERQAVDAQEFELAGLTDDEDDDQRNLIQRESKPRTSA